MKQSLQIQTLCLFLLAGFIQTFGQSSVHSKIQIAVLELEGRGISKDEAATLSDRLRGRLVNTGAFIVLNREKMNDMLKEQSFQQSGCTVTACAVKIGAMLNVQKIVAGTIGKIGEIFTIDISLIDIESTLIERSFQKDYIGEPEGLLAVLDQTAREMAKETNGRNLGRSNNSKQKHALVIDSNPKGAVVKLNGRKRGKTPVSGNVPHGVKVEITIERKGYEIWQKALTINNDVNLNVDLLPSENQGGGSNAWLLITGGVVAAGAGAYFLLSQQKEPTLPTELLPPFQWPPGN